MVAQRPTFEIVCIDCGSLSIKIVSAPAGAPVSTMIECGRCSSPRGTLEGLHQLARQGNQDLFGF
jgi:hypothetical protein